MIRKIIKIDEAKCIGCGLCASACHEGAIEMINGKAHLIREDYCDGFGDCLPECPTQAIQIQKREAAAYDEIAVQRHKQSNMCPGHQVQMFERKDVEQVSLVQQSQLRQWPVQIQLLPMEAPFYENAKLLIAADCTAYAYANFHQDFIQGHIVCVGCPKLDPVDYSEKLTAILSRNKIKSVKIVRMEVPCCGGLEMAAKKALQASGKFIPWQVVTISRDGRILDE